MGKKLVLLMILVMIGGLVGCVPKGKKENVGVNKTVTAGAESASTQEWKTYVSKWGFSVDYPVDWFLWEEWSGSENGWIPPFGIVDKDPNISPNIIPEEKRVGIGFNAWDASGNMPQGIKERLIYIVSKQQMSSIDSLEIINKRDELFCLVYGVPLGKENKRYELVFYLPHARRRFSDEPSIKMFGVAEIERTGKYSIYELIDKIKIKVQK